MTGEGYGRNKFRQRVIFYKNARYFDAVTPIKTIRAGTERLFLVSLHTHSKFNRYSKFDEDPFHFNIIFVRITDIPTLKYQQYHYHQI